MTIKFIKTIKFRLTVWYSVLLLLLAVLFLFFANVTITRYYNGPINQARRYLWIKRQPIPITYEDKKIEFIKELRTRDLNVIREISLFSLIPLAFLSFTGGYIIAGQMLRPIKQLNSSIKATNARNLKQLVPFEDTGDEFSELAHNFNSMISRLHRTFEAQNQFVEDASHELKTPLAIIKANLETITPHSLNPDETKSLITALNSVTFMNILTENLLLLSTLDQPVDMKHCNFVNIVKDCIENLHLLARKKGIKILLNNGTSSTLAKVITVNGNPLLLYQAITNIIENAIKYSPKDSIIAVSLTTENNQVYLRITDQGKGIPKEKRLKVFERFYRIDKSRSRSSGGTGLGLPIAKRIIELHNGTISIVPNKPSGSTFIILLPTTK